MQYNSLKRKRESAFSPNPKKKQIFLPPKQPSRAPVSRCSSRKPLPDRAVRAALPLKRRSKTARGTKMKKMANVKKKLDS